jgi:hypothetical protein
MLSRYSHVRMEATRRALDKIAARQNAAEEKPCRGSRSIGVQPIYTVQNGHATGVKLFVKPAYFSVTPAGTPKALDG